MRKGISASIRAAIVYLTHVVIVCAAKRSCVHASIIMIIRSVERRPLVVHSIRLTHANRMVSRSSKWSKGGNQSAAIQPTRQTCQV
ncbi:hypothetical protein F5Y18DRAFT_386177 [Xylariaceae sp. FL1019]|nr:hypothetical protein F5Y18DRAFT_386177 [Xylariaceae sp. FL1019]